MGVESILLLLGMGAIALRPIAFGACTNKYKVSENRFILSLAKPHGGSGEWLGPARYHRTRTAPGREVFDCQKSRRLALRPSATSPLPVHATGAVQVDGARLTRMRCRTKDPHN